MMIAAKKQLFYSDNLLIKIYPALREALAAAAERERTSMSELYGAAFARHMLSTARPKQDARNDRSRTERRFHSPRFRSLVP
jgi:hypothetical protein